MPQLMSTSVSYKNHKRYKKDQSEWVVVHNTHEPIISQELWDRVREREKSVAQGRKTATGYTHPLSGFLYCADCGCKMKLNSVGNNKYAFNCGDHMRFGKAICFSHHIAAKTQPNTPFVTLEYSLRNHKILQCYGEHDHKPNEDEACTLLTFRHRMSIRLFPRK